MKKKHPIENFKTISSKDLEKQELLVLGAAVHNVAPTSFDRIVSRLVGRCLGLDSVPPTTGYLLLSAGADLLGKDSVAAGIAHGLLYSHLAQMGTTFGTRMGSKKPEEPPPDNVRDLHATRRSAL